MGNSQEETISAPTVRRMGTPRQVGGPRDSMETWSQTGESVMAAGSYDLEGTCVIRTSKHLSEEDQKKLTKAVREARLEVD